MGTEEEEKEVDWRTKMIRNKAKHLINYFWDQKNNYDHSIFRKAFSSIVLVEKRTTQGLLSLHDTILVGSFKW
jgi:hypothetical protein